MSKQKGPNNGPYIRNGNMIANGPKATPINGSHVEGVRAQMAEQAKINAAKQATQQTPKVQPTTTPKRGMTP